MDHVDVLEVELELDPELVQAMITCSLRLPAFNITEIVRECVLREAERARLAWNWLCRTICRVRPVADVAQV